MPAESQPLEKKPSGGFLAALRQATAPMHERLEENPLSKALLSDTVSKKEYGDYLKKMEGVIRFSDETLLPILAAVLPASSAQKKGGWIESDLQHFQIPTDEPQESFQPFQTAGIPFALGYFYVIEGSTLGGRVILKQIKSRLNIDAGAGGRFFHAYGEDTSANWKSFLQTLTSYASDHNAEDEIIHGAQDAFEAIRRHFES